jgi:16S rRNA (cytosine967-C5)-methyltransferase
VRAAAARIVARVVGERAGVEELLAAAPPVAERDRPLLAALALGALRWHHRLEWQAGRLLSRPLQPEQTVLAALLRIGLLQLQALRVPAHAAVSATVDATAEIGARGAAGLVNAVLRRFQRERAALERDQAGVPEARFSHPAWLIDAVRADWPDDWQRILDANNALPPMWLRVNVGRTSRADYLATLARAGVAATASPEIESAVRLDEPQSVETLPGFGEGLVSVQDLSAQRAAGWLMLHPGQRVLDACAAPGGKTGHILESCPSATVWAVDRNAERLAKVGENLARLGLHATLVAGDAAEPEAWWDGRPFERILLDAPCSAVGVIRRHPDIKLLRRPGDVARVVTLQTRLLRALWPLLAPGGRLVYSTCTVLKRENADLIAAFAAAEPAAAQAVAVEVAAQFLPEEARGDGFYYAALVKPNLLRTPSGPAPQP